MAAPSLAALDAALHKVYHAKADVDAALCTDGLGPQTLACLERVQQQLNELHALAPQVQQLAATCEPAAAAASQPQEQRQEQQQHLGGAGLTALQQQHAGRAAAALQQHVTAALRQPPGRGLPCISQPGHQEPQAAPATGHDLLTLLQRVAAAAPQLHVHLFKSSSNHLLFSYRGERDRLARLDAQSAGKLVGHIDELRVECGAALCAAIALAAPGQLLPVRLSVDSGDRVSSVDAWSPSKHQVFKRISNLSVRALYHFQQLEAAQRLLQPQVPTPAAPSSGGGAAGSSGQAGSGGRPVTGLALECLLLWLACYDDLFSRPCHVSGKLVAWEPATAVPLPPVLRPYWLSLEELTAAAQDRSRRQVFHAHLAPWSLQQQQPIPEEGAAGWRQAAGTDAAASVDAAARACCAVDTVADEVLLQKWQQIVAEDDS